MAKKATDYVPVIGGRKLTADDLRADFSGAGDLDAHSAIDLQIVRLLALHPKVRVQFRSQDLSKLNNSTKKLLLKDINDVLGIKSLR